MNSPPPAQPIVQSPGALLSAASALPDHLIHQISIDMLPLQHSAHLVNVADNIGEGWLDLQDKILRFHFHMLILFGNAKVDKLWLASQNFENRIALSPTFHESPGISTRYTETPWSSQSRIVLNENIVLPEWAIGSDRFALVAEVAGKPEKIGHIFINEIYIGASVLHSQPQVPVSSPDEATLSTNQEDALGLPNTLPEQLLPFGDVPPDAEAHRISLSILNKLGAGHLVNFSDGLESGWLDQKSMRLRLKFHIVTVFSDASVKSFWLVASGKNTKIPLSPTCVASPVVGQAHSTYPWASQSRFIFDEFVELTSEIINSTKFELIADVSGKAVKIGIISVADEIITHNMPGISNIEAIISPASTASPATTDRHQNSVGIAARSPALNALAEDRKVFTTYSKVISKRVKQLNLLFFFTVVIPTLTSIVYFGLIASDVYISESRFVVRSPQHQIGSGLSALIQGAGFSRSQDDSYAVQDYIFSRDALKHLETQLALSKEYSSNQVDIFSRFAGLTWDNSFEALYLYYQKHITIELDTLSSISTLSVRAFSPEAAYQVNMKLLDMSESLVNQLNERGKQDLIRFAQGEVAQAEQRVKSAALAVSYYRNQKGVFNPEGQSALQLQQVSKIQEELTASKIQLAQIKSQAIDNPQISGLQKRIETLQAEINSETSKVVGGDRSLSQKAPDFASLELERGFAEKQLAAALASLLQARNDAEHQQLYLERIDQPNKPDVAVEPRRLRNIFATLIIGLIAWGILSMLLAGLREHQN